MNRWILISFQYLEIVIKNRRIMQSPKYCHNISEANYFSSPKMPTKDLGASLKSGKSSMGSSMNSFKSSSSEASNLEVAVMKMKEMNLLNGKTLTVVNHLGPKDGNINSDSHSRQTNPGYTRNKLGGFYTS